MDALEQARAEIDTVDAQLAALFERRMAAVLQVAEYKRAHGLPVYDAARETAVLEKAAARIQDPALRPYYKDHVQKPDGRGKAVRSRGAEPKTAPPIRAWRALLLTLPSGRCSPTPRL